MDKAALSALISMIHKTAWDCKAREEFLTDPRRMLRQAGVDLADNEKVFVHENKPGEYHLVLPLPVDKIYDVPVDHPLIPEKQ